MTALPETKKAKRAPMSKMRKQKAIAGYVFILPAILGLVFLTYGQMLVSFVLSLTDWSVIKEASFVGLDNYVKLLTEDPFFWKSIRVTMYYAFGSVVAVQLTALGMALLLNVKYIKGKVFYRTIFYLPSIVPAVATSLLWMWLFNPDFGLLNAVLKVFGLPKSMWIFAESTAVPSMILMSAWGSGGAMVIYLAGLQGVPNELLEAVDIDGGGAWAKFRYCTIPMISPVLFYNTLMGIIGGFMTFTNTYIMTNGGPNNATLFTNFLIYRNAFQYNQMGYASALAWIVFIVLAAVTVFVFTTSGRWVYYGDSSEK